MRCGFLASFCLCLAMQLSHASGLTKVVVAPDGAGDFKTIQMAIDHAPPYGENRLIIEIRPGAYHERVVVPQDRPRVVISIAGSESTFAPKAGTTGTN